MLKLIDKIDNNLSKKIYNIINSNKILYNIPFYFGLLPYEIYVILGMYIGILQVIWLNISNPIQLHLLPLWFTYSLFGFLKNKINRKRPNFENKTWSRYDSLPSGHSGVIFALAVALYMEMMHSQDSKLFEIRIKSLYTRKVIAFTGFIVALMVIIERVSKGYHYLGDCICGAILGSIIGYISWNVINMYKEKYYKSCESKINKDKDKDKECEDYDREINESVLKDIIYKLKENIYNEEGNLRILNILSKTVLSIIVIYMMYIFLSRDIWNIHMLVAE